MKTFEDEEYFLLKSLSNQVVAGVEPALERTKKVCESMILEIEAVDKSLEEAVSGFDINKFSKMSQDKRNELIRLLAVKNRIDVLLKRNKERVAYIDNILSNAGIYNQDFNRKKIAEVEKDETPNISEDTLNLNIFEEENTAFESTFFDGEILELKDGKLDFSNENNMSVLMSASEDLLAKIVRVYPASMATVPVQAVLNTGVKKRVLRTIATYVVDESKKKDIRQVNKDLGSLLEFKTEITKTPEDYIAGVTNMFNSMIKAHLLETNPEKAEQINSKLKCNEKSELIPAAKRVAIMAAGLGGDITPEKEESEEERIAREKELGENAANAAFRSMLQAEQEAKEIAQIEQIEQTETAAKLAELERVNLEKQKKQEEQKSQAEQEQEEMQRMMSKNKYDD